MARFLALWLVALLALVSATLALTVAVDPYGILGAPRWHGLTEEKIAGADWPLLAKPYLIEAARPQTVVLGSSSVDIGIDPDSPAWPSASRPVFNLGIDGAGPPTQLRFLQHAFAEGHPKLVLIGVSFEDSLSYPPDASRRAATAPANFESRLRVTADGQPNLGYTKAWLQDLLFATLSVDALKDSVATLLRQGDRFETHETILGFNSAGRFARWTRNEGQFSLVMDKDRTKAAELLNWSRHRLTVVQPIADMIHLAQGRGAQVIVFVVPNYVDEIEMHRQIGITGRVQAWKAQLASIVEQSARADQPVPLWDFSGFSRYTTEPMPGPGVTGSELQWVWEPIHFRAALGTLMIARMMGENEPSDLGIRLTTDQLTARNTEYETLQRAWVAAHPSDVARIAGVLDEAAHHVCHTDVADCWRDDARQTAVR